MGPTLFANSNFDFVGKRYLFLGLSAVLGLVTIGSLATRSLNFGVEFTGGVQIEVNFDEGKETRVPPSIEAVRTALADAGLGNATVTTIGAEEEHDFLIRVQSPSQAEGSIGISLQKALVQEYGADRVTYFTFDEESLDSARVRIEGDPVDPDALATVVRNATLEGLKLDDIRADEVTGLYTLAFENPTRDILAAFDARFGEGTYETSIDSIGAAVSKDLRRQAFLAIAAACLLISVYVWLRFDIDFAPGVIVALIHDAGLTIGLWSLTGWDFNLTIVAALLAIIGYSVNDTVVVYDRIRENIHKHESKTMGWVINKSVNETLSRTILTSLTSLLAVLAIAIFGSESIRWFGVAMIFGLLSGTYSTIYVATPITVWVYEFRERQRRAQEAAGARQSQHS